MTMLRAATSSVSRYRHRRNVFPTFQQRHVAGLAAKLASRFLRLRYLIFGAGVGGTYAASQKYEDFKSSLPDMSFITELFPQNESFENALSEIKEFTAHANDLRRDYLEQLKTKFFSMNQRKVNGEAPVVALTGGSGDESSTQEKHEKPDALRIHELQQALVKNELEYHKRMDELMQENKTLRAELLLRSQRPAHRGRIKKSLIEMYSEVLDELSDLDSAYNAQDQLPRVVVVGDQSAGKTSVLEMIVQARIFPRGSGEMMTRSPVKVTLSEGPYHVASFKDSPREYDLTKETELAALRSDIEMRMKALVSGGKTISSEVISLTVKGPGLQRVVLVDLPGIISTVTSGMHADTRETIQNLAKHYMSNPNAIILCVQDGSIDAERSNVTDLVSSIDPSGKRTIFVLTKVDLAESNLYNPNRIKQILEGKLFPMKALGYFAVVTGKGSKDESIESIKAYEEDFFRKSRLFSEGALKLSQMTTANMSKAVSERFWKMVKESVEQQADTYRAFRYNLEAEWKNSFSHLREMDRDELFDKGRSEILDDLVSLNGIGAAAWEKKLRARLWEDLQEHVFREIFEPSQQLDDLGAYQTNIDIWLRDWVEKNLPLMTVQTGWRTLYDELDTRLRTVKSNPGHDPIFDQLRDMVHRETRKRHHWDQKAESHLRVIQSNALDDKTVHEKSQWAASVEFLDQALRSRMKAVDQSITELCGPGWLKRWLRWQSRTAEQRLRHEVAQEIETLLASYTKPSLEITGEDLTTIRRNLQARNISVHDKMISETWQPLVRRVYLIRSLYNCHECQRSYYYYQQGLLSTSNPELSRNGKSVDQEDKLSGAGDPTSHLSSEFPDCREVILFYRLMRMVESSSNALRQQIMNDEARRLEHYVKQVLSELADNPIELRKLIVGRRVTLAEELKRVRYVQDKLEEFIAALNKGE